MRADAFFAALQDAPIIDLDGLTGGRGLVVVAPHPDDESLGCGGLIAQARARGRDVRLVILTDGTGSHPHSESLTALMLRDIREAETLRAAAELGLPASAVTFLRLQDAHTPSTGPVAEEAAGAIGAAARACDASAIFVTWPHDPHCDHKAAAAIVARAAPHLAGARIFAYTIWGGALPPETEVGPPPAAFRIDVRAERAAKRRAVTAHISQVAGLPGGHVAPFRLEESMIDRICGPHETYWEMSR